MTAKIMPHRYQHKIPVTDFMSTLQSVQINPSEMCNRTCGICPRHDPSLYKNNKLFLSTETSRIIGRQLSEFGFRGRVGFVGFGEPLLNPNLVECVRILREECKTAQWIEINTNGDFLTRELIIDLTNAGCTHITVSMYDSDNSDHFNRLFDGINVVKTLRHNYDLENTQPIFLVDRSGIVRNEIKSDNNRQCFIPFYKLFIDWNGDYLLCDQDWGKVTKEFNLYSTSITEFWKSKIDTYRKNLIAGDRYKNNPCHSCDIVGNLIGKESFDFISTAT